MGWLAVLWIAALVQTAAAQYNGSDSGSGAKFALSDPANSQRHAVQDYFAGGKTQFGFRNQNAEFVYNLTNVGARRAGSTNTRPTRSTSSTRATAAGAG